MNFLETAVLATICLRLRSSGLSVLAAAALTGAGGTPVEEAGVAGADTRADATCALMCDTDSLYCLRLSTYSRGVRIGDCCRTREGIMIK